MVRVVIDTNLIVSSLLKQEGNPALVFKMFLRGEIENFITAEILTEVKEVLRREKITKKISLKEMELVFNALEEFSEKIKPGVTFEEVKDDPDDNKFLDCAVSASADYIISGDEHLLGLAQFRGIQIVSPAEFVKRMMETKGEWTRRPFSATFINHLQPPCPTDDY